MTVSTKKMRIRAMWAGALVFFLFTSAAMAQTVAIVGPSSNCQGNSLTLTVNITGLTGPFTYAWLNGATTATITINSSQVARVTVTGTAANGNQKSVKSQPRVFLFFPSPLASIASSGSTNLCDNASVNLTANSQGFFKAYSWSTGATTKSISVTNPGVYAVTITNQFGCSGQAEQLVTAIPPALPKITAQGMLTFCKPGSVTLDADPAVSGYMWNTGESTQSITVMLTGSGGPVLDTVSIAYMMNPGTFCEAQSEIVVVRSIRSPKLELPYCPNFNLALSDSIRVEKVLAYAGNPASYEHEFVETTNPGVSTTIVSNGRWLQLSNVQPALQVGKFYNVRSRAVIDGIPYCYGNACVIGISGLSPMSNNVIRTVYDEDGDAYQVRESLGFGVFPNPSAGEFTASLFTRDLEMISVSIFDMSGRQVAAFEADPSNNAFQFGADLLPGMYMVKFNQGETLHQTVKIIKTH